MKSQRLISALAAVTVSMLLSKTECSICLTKCTQQRSYCYQGECFDKCPEGLRGIPDLVVDPGDHPDRSFISLCGDMDCPGGFYLNDDDKATCYPEWVKTRKFLIIGGAMLVIIVGMTVFLSTKRFDRNCCKNRTVTGCPTHEREVKDYEPLINTENEIV